LIRASAVVIGFGKGIENGIYLRLCIIHGALSPAREGVYPCVVLPFNAGVLELSDSSAILGRIE
jgi:hypothetical protein